MDHNLLGLVVVGDIAMIASAAVFTAFVITYSIIADWKATKWGRAMMRLHGGIAFVLDFGAVARFIHMNIHALLWFRIFAYGIVVALGVQQLAMLIKVQRDARRGRHHVR